MGEKEKFKKLGQGFWREGRGEKFVFLLYTFNVFVFTRENPNSNSNLNSNLNLDLDFQNKSIESICQGFQSVDKITI